MLSSLIYFAFVAGVGYYANSKGRSPIVWSLVAFITTPLLAAIILAFLKNLKDEQNVKQIMNQQEQINDRISVNEINNNRRFEKVEQKVEQIETKQASAVEAAPAAIAGAAVATTEPSVEAASENVEPVAPSVEEAEQAPAAAVVEPAQAPVAHVAEEASVAKCPYCDSEVPAGSKFCGSCGAKL